MKKNNIILLTVLIMLVIYCGAVIFVTKPEGFDISSLFTNNATLSTEDKTALKSEIKSEVESELSSQIADAKSELSSQISDTKSDLSDELSAELSAQLSAELESKIEALIDEKLDQKLDQKLAQMSETEQVAISEDDYNAIRDQIRNEEIDNLLSLLED